MALTPVSTTQVPLTPEEQQIYNQIKFTGSSSTQGNISQYYEYGGKQYAVNLDTSKLPPGPGALAYTDAQKAVLAAISAGTSAAPTTAPGIPIYQSPGVASTVPAPISPTERVQQGIVPTPSSTLPVPPPAQPVPQPAPQVGGVQPQPQSTPLTQQQYFLQPGETPEQYNQRIAQLRGDTPENLARVQQLTQQKAGAGFQQTSQQLAQQPQSTQVAPQSMQLAQLPSADGGLLQQTGLPSELSTTTIDDVIQKVSAAFGLTDVSKELQKVTDQEGVEIQEANENPWISEGLRVKKIQAIQGKYESKKNALVERLRLQQDVVGKAIDVYYKERTLKQELLFKQLDLQSKLFAEPKTTDDIREYEYAKSQGFPGTMLDYFKQKSASTGGGGLSPANIQGTINQITGAFDNEPVVKNFNVSAAGFQTMANIKDSTTNPADDIAMIYQFAKIMDPNSVVREGEYAVVQRYAQSWAQSFGFNAARVFSNTKFLTTKAIQNMKAAANAKFQADKGAYENLYDEYNRKIEEAKGGQIGGSLPNYAGGFGVASGQSEPIPESTGGGDPDTIPIGGTYSAGGVLYLRVGADEFEPIGSAVQ